MTCPGQLQDSVPAKALVLHDIPGIAAHADRLDLRPEHPDPAKTALPWQLPAASKMQGIFDP
jgi:hypothetical protein